LVLPQAGRQGSVLHVCPGTAVAKSPEPMVSVKVVVPAADEEHVVWDADSCVDTWIGQEQHFRRRLYNDGSRRPDVHVYVDLAARLRRQRGAQEHQEQDRACTGDESFHEVSYVKISSIG